MKMTITRKDGKVKFEADGGTVTPEEFLLGLLPKSQIYTYRSMSVNWTVEKPIFNELKVGEEFLKLLSQKKRDRMSLEEIDDIIFQEAQLLLKFRNEMESQILPDDELEVTWRLV